MKLQCLMLYKKLEYRTVRPFINRRSNASLDIVADSIKRYKAIELDVFLNDVHDEYNKKLSDL